MSQFPTLRLASISKIYPNGHVALSDVQFEVEKKSICGIIGKSGAGKSTLLRCINGLEIPEKGSVFFNGSDLTRLNPQEICIARKKIGMIFQQFHLISSRTVFENIAFAMEITGASQTQIHSRVHELLKLIQLEDKAEYYPVQLSGGQQQRVAIARALANQPELLLCDEATSALDPETTQSILDLLKKINQTLNLTIVLITHDINVIKTLCNQVIVLDEGKIVEQSDVLHWFTNPQSDIGKNFVHHALYFHLSPDIQKTFHIDKTPNQHPVIRIEFIGDSTKESVISQLVTRFNVHSNILQAHVAQIQEQAIGILFIELQDQNTASNEAITEAIQYLKTQKLAVEVVGYAQR